MTEHFCPTSGLIEVTARFCFCPTADIRRARAAVLPCSAHLVVACVPCITYHFGA